MLIINTKKQSDQAEELKKLISEVENIEVKPSFSSKKNENEIQDIDILNLPSRKEIHHNKKISMNLKINKSVIRLLFVISLTLLVILSIIYLSEYNIINLNYLFNF